MEQTKMGAINGRDFLELPSAPVVLREIIFIGNPHDGTPSQRRMKIAGRPHPHPNPPLEGEKRWLQ
jgi:hypothetical protein